MFGNVKIVFKRVSSEDTGYTNILDGKYTIVLTYEKSNVIAKDMHDAVKNVLSDPKKLLSAVNFYKNQLKDFGNLLKNDPEYEVLESAGGRFGPDDGHSVNRLPPYIVVELKPKKKK